MRCPSCGFVSFDHLTACKKCGKEVPPPPGGRRMPAPVPVPVPPSIGQPMAAPGGSAGSLDSFFAAPAGDPGSETMLMGGQAPAPAAPSARPEDTFSFNLPPAAAAPPRPAGTTFDSVTAAREIEVDHAPAGFWIRFVALIVDGIILSVAAYFVTKTLGMRDISVTPGEPMEMLMEAVRQVSLLAGVNTLIWLLYSVIFVGWRGQTPGKILLKLKIIRVDGGDVDFLKAFIRWIGYGISAIILLIGYIMAAFTENKRALHDLIAGTRVVRL